MKVTSEQLHILQHSLGVDRYGKGTQYRNRYVVGPECDTFNECRALCDLGLMRDHGANEICGGMHIFSVTHEGVRAMTDNSPAPPKLTRSQRRYRDFLKADLGIPFGEYIKIKHASEAAR